MTETLEQEKDTPPPEEGFESAEQLSEQIRELNAKLAKKQIEELAEETGNAAVKFPLANITLKLDKNGSNIDLEGVTPPEVLFLVAEHHANAGGNPIEKIVPQKKCIEVDPVHLRAKLSQKYSVTKIASLFPGTEPKMPTGFVRAMSLGGELKTEDEGFLDFQVKPLGTGAT